MQIKNVLILLYYSIESSKAAEALIKSRYMQNTAKLQTLHACMPHMHADRKHQKPAISARTQNLVHHAVRFVYSAAHYHIILRYVLPFYLSESTNKTNALGLVLMHV